MKKSEFKAQREEKRNVSVEGVEADVITLHGIKKRPKFPQRMLPMRSHGLVHWYLLNGQTKRHYWTLLYILHEYLL